MKKAALFFVLLMIPVFIAAGCGSDSQGQTTGTTTTTATTSGRIQKYTKGEEFTIYDFNNKETYRATVVADIIDPYVLPYTTQSERVKNNIMFDPKPGYKYVKINLSVSNPSKYPATYSTSDYLVFDERDQAALFVGGTIGPDTNVWAGKELLPGDSIQTSLIYQMAEAAHPAIMEGRFIGKDNGQKIAEINLS